MKPIILALLITITYGCNRANNNALFENLKREFADSISKDKAEKVEYSYDALSPQQSFFVNGRLKYLQYHHGPEGGSVDVLVYFDPKTDSVSKLIRREVFRELEVDRQTDSIFVVLNTPQRTLKYSGNKLVDSSFDGITYELDRAFIRSMKKATESYYRSR